MNKERLKEIYLKYNLEKDDIFELKFGNNVKHIITRSGIEKIQQQEKISCQYKIENISDDHKHVVIIARGVVMKKSKDGSEREIPTNMTETFGECSPSNNTQKYPIAMAEKRALARLVIKMANLFGMYSEDEAEEFKRK